MVVQDDIRENEIIQLLGLKKGTERYGVDSFYDFQEDGINYAAEIELKSTSGGTVSTARDVGMAHIHKWRNRLWIIGYYDSTGTALQRLVCLSPEDMEPWIKKTEDYIRPDFTIGERAAEKLQLEDLFIVCGQKTLYTIKDAKALHKQQWKKDRYVAEQDVKGGYSPAKMLEILKLRAVYLNDRGSTLNNPHITLSFLKAFKDREVTVSDLQKQQVVSKIHSFLKQEWMKIIKRQESRAGIPTGPL